VGKVREISEKATQKSAKGGQAASKRSTHHGTHLFHLIFYKKRNQKGKGEQREGGKLGKRGGGPSFAYGTSSAEETGVLLGGMQKDRSAEIQEGHLGASVMSG